MALSAAQMQEAVINNLPAKTGKTLDEWIRIAKAFNLSKSNEILKKLKSEYNLGHVQAQTIVWRMGEEKPYVETKGYEENIFKKTFDLYEKLKSQIQAISDDISVKPCKTYIPFYRNNQFAILTEKKGELVLGLNLKTEHFPELVKAEKLGGSDRINKMIVVNNDNLSMLNKYVKEAYSNN
jgi:predicted transport protein